MSSTVALTDKPASPDSSHSANPHYAFYGSNSSHSNENGTGGRTYHVPNYATSYANERTNLIHVTFDEGKGSQRVIITLIVAFLLFTAVPLSKIVIGMSQHEGLHSNVSLPTFTLDEHEAFPTPSLIQTVLAEAVDAPYSGKYAAWNLSWDEPKAALRCHSFGNKEYTARLQNLPLFSDWVDACNHTPVIINGIKHVKPAFCESMWPWGGVIGRWTVETGSEECRPHWGNIKDKVGLCVNHHFLTNSRRHWQGCIGNGSRFRRYESRLRDIKEKEDWKLICSTAPAEIRQNKIMCPTSCHDWGFWGIYGVWEVDDPAC